MNKYDVIVIGAGPGGIAAAKAAAEQGAQVIVLEREQQAGGILNQCVHDGFGLVRYTKQLSGPEYAEAVLAEAMETGVEIKCETIVTDLEESDSIETGSGKKKILVSAVNKEGLIRYEAGAVVLATGCRERTRGMISIPGSRPAGIYTAGVAQNLVNMKNMMVGKNVVIYGTGDIGLIMARRMTLEGAKVKCAIEIKDNASGLSRNVRQCLEDYNIPIYLNTSITRIIGKKRLEAIEISEIDEDGKRIPNSQKIIECDTLILSVGLIPENELAESAGAALDNKNNGAVTDDYLQTTIPGVFACGNCRQVMDLADFVSMQGETAGWNAAHYAKASADKMERWLTSPHNIARKGVPEKNTVVCTMCPKGCEITMGESIKGNGCKKGETFIRQELQQPQRILTSTVKLMGGQKHLLPVRSDKPVDLREMKEICEWLKQKQVVSPVESGQIIASEVGQNKVNIVAECKG